MITNFHLSAESRCRGLCAPARWRYWQALALVLKPVHDLLAFQ
jgi:hypothetical protein